MDPKIKIKHVDHNGQLINIATPSPALKGDYDKLTEILQQYITAYLVYKRKNTAFNVVIAFGLIIVLTTLLFGNNNEIISKLNVSALITETIIATFNLFRLNWSNRKINHLRMAVLDQVKMVEAKEKDLKKDQNVEEKNH